MTGSGLKSSFFHVVNVEEKLPHFARRVTELRNVSLEIFLDLLLKDHRAEEQRISLFHLTIAVGVFLCRVLSDPTIDLIVRRAGGNELLEFHCVEPVNFQK